MPVGDLSITVRRFSILKGGARRPMMTASPFNPGPIMHAAAQQHPGTMQTSRGLLRPPVIHPTSRGAPPPVMTNHKPRQFYIQGLTLEGRTFRPSDWSERLAGAMSCFRPGGGQGGIGAFIGYSPYCVPHVQDNVRCVLVNEALKGIEPMAWDFVMNFARDNQLEVTEVCALPT